MEGIEKLSCDGDGGVFCTGPISRGRRGSLITPINLSSNFSRGTSYCVCQRWTTTSRERWRGLDILPRLLSHCYSMHKYPSGLVNGEVCRPSLKCFLAIHYSALALIGRVWWRDQVCRSSKPCSHFRSRWRTLAAEDKRPPSWTPTEHLVSFEVNRIENGLLCPPISQWLDTAKVRGLDWSAVQAVVKGPE